MRLLRDYKRITALLSCALYSLAWLMAPAAFANGNKEYYVKAAFLFNFAKFIDWPVESISNDTLHVCIKGKDPFGDAIQILGKEKANNRQLVVHYDKDKRDITQCHVLFFSKSEEKTYPKILKSIADQPILTVSEIPGFVDQGGMVGFTTVDGRIKLEMHYPATVKSGLDADPTLFEIAVRVVR